MDDTSKKMTQKMREMFQEKTPEERFLMGCSMYDTSKNLVISYIKENNPNISPSELRQQIFLKFYGNDFDAVTKEKILKYLAEVKDPI